MKKLKFQLSQLKKIFFGAAAAVTITATLTASSLAYDTMQDERNYTYNYNNNDQMMVDVYIPDAYSYNQTINLVDNKGVQVKNPGDLFVSSTGEIYVADTGNSRIMIFDKNFNFEKSITQVKDSKGNVTQLNQPQGIYVYKNGEMLIADTQNNRIVKCDGNGNATLFITKPSGMTGVGAKINFMPMKLSVDSIGRIYVVAQSINEGFLELDEQGNFITYTGAPTVSTDPFTVFWRKFSTQAQKNAMVQFVPTEYNSIFIDDQDFVWGTISELKASDIANAINSKDKSGSVAPIRKMNSTGGDVLRRDGMEAPLGDLWFSGMKDPDSSNTISPSRIVDVALGQDGTYSILDQNRCHIFTYDSEGNLLYVFGSKGTRKSSMSQPDALCYVGRNIIVLDSQNNQLQEFSPTTYGNNVLDAVSDQYKGNFKAANAKWTNIANENTNFQYAFEGLGNANLSQKNYVKAMQCYQYAHEPDDYSTTYVLLRKDRMKIYFPIIFSVLLIIIVILIIYSIIKKIYIYYKGYYEINYRV